MIRKVIWQLQHLDNTKSQLPDFQARRNTPRQ